MTRPCEVCGVWFDSSYITETCCRAHRPNAPRPPWWLNWRKPARGKRAGRRH